MSRLPDLSPEVQARFNAFLETQGDCVVFTGGTRNSKGYGSFWAGRTVAAHRYAWILANGEIPARMIVDHLCFNPKCVNVEHLRLVSNKQNQEHRAGAPINNTSGYRGVSWNSVRNKWQASVQHNGRGYWAGFHATAESANDAAVAMRQRLFTHNDELSPREAVTSDDCA